MEVFQNVHSQAVFEKNLNASFLAFIPQKVNVVKVKDFQPISLVGGSRRLFLRCWLISFEGWHMGLFQMHRMHL